ncbi:MAG: transposase [Nitrospirae bacterium]|nr:transposase [Nitrospirota bacterium]
MARKPRIEYEGAFYHVICRGNQKQKIFKDAEDYAKYLDLLRRYKTQCRCFLYSYVLMNNHVHLLIETQAVPLSKILQGVSQSYTQYFNRKYRTVGHLFQGRYKAILCDKDEYLLALIKYMHLNPVRAKIVKDPAEYHWSGHRSYAGKKDKQGLIDTDQVLRMFSEDKAAARRRYKEFMGDTVSVKKEDIYSTVDQRILGDESFVDRVQEHYDAEKIEGKRTKEYTLKEIASVVEGVLEVSLEEMRGKGKDRQISKGRQLLSVVAREYGYKCKEIAEYMRKDNSVVTRYLSEKENLKGAIGKVMEKLKEARTNVNKQV